VLGDVLKELSSEFRLICEVKFKESVFQIHEEF